MTAIGLAIGLLIGVIITSVPDRRGLRRIGDQVMDTRDAAEVTDAANSPKDA